MFLNRLKPSFWLQCTKNGYFPINSIVFYRKQWPKQLTRTKDVCYKLSDLNIWHIIPPCDLESTCKRWWQQHKVSIKFVFQASYRSCGSDRTKLQIITLRIVTIRASLSLATLFISIRHLHFFYYKQPFYKQPGLRFFKNNNRIQ